MDADEARSRVEIGDGVLTIRHFVPEPTSDDVRSVEFGSLHVVLAQVEGWLFFHFQLGAVPWARVPITTMAQDGDAVVINVASIAACPRLRFALVDESTGGLRASRNVIAPGEFHELLVEHLRFEAMRRRERPISLAEYRREIERVDSELPPPAEFIDLAQAGELPNVELVTGFFVRAFKF